MVGPPRSARNRRDGWRIGDASLTLESYLDRGYRVPCAALPAAQWGRSMTILCAVADLKPSRP